VAGQRFHSRWTKFDIHQAVENPSSPSFVERSTSPETGGGLKQPQTISINQAKRYFSWSLRRERSAGNSLSQFLQTLNLRLQPPAVRLTLWFAYAV